MEQPEFLEAPAGQAQLAVLAGRAEQSALEV